MSVHASTAVSGMTCGTLYRHAAGRMHLGGEERTRATLRAIRLSLAGRDGGRLGREQETGAGGIEIALLSLLKQHGSFPSDAKGSQWLGRRSSLSPSPQRCPGMSMVTRSGSRPISLECPMVIRQVDFVSWVLRVLTWDSLLPACVILFPTAIAFLLPNNRGAIEITGVVLPIAGFVLRVRAGRRQITSNHCAATMRHVQLGSFVVGILILTLIDAVLVLSHVMPQGALFADKTDRVVWAILFFVYLASMSIAMYPGVPPLGLPPSQNA
jgi:hypothetical protein